MADTRYKEAEASLEVVASRMETIAYVTERLQLVMDMGEAIVEVSLEASKLLPCFELIFV